MPWNSSPYDPYCDVVNPAESSRNDVYQQKDSPSYPRPHNHQQQHHSHHHPHHHHEVGEDASSFRSVTSVDQLVETAVGERSQKQPQQQQQHSLLLSPSTTTNSTTVPPPPPPPPPLPSKPDHLRYDSATNSTATTTATSASNSPAGLLQASSSSSSSILEQPQQQPTQPQPQPQPQPRYNNNNDTVVLHDDDDDCSPQQHHLLRSQNDETVLSLRDMFQCEDFSNNNTQRSNSQRGGGGIATGGHLRRSSSRESYLDFDDIYEDNSRQDDEDDDDCSSRSSGSDGERRHHSRRSRRQQQQQHHPLHRTSNNTPFSLPATAHDYQHPSGELAVASSLLSKPFSSSRCNTPTFQGASLSSSWSSSGAAVSASNAAAAAAPMVIHNNINNYHRPIMAYCAIGGSLEDPSGNSFGWRQRAMAAQQQQQNKYEFPSVLGLLPPPNQVAQKKKQQQLSSKLKDQQQQQQQQAQNQQQLQQQNQKYNSSKKGFTYDSTPVARTSKKSLIAANADVYNTPSNTTCRKTAAAIGSTIESVVAETATAAGAISDSQDSSLQNQHQQHCNMTNGVLQQAHEVIGAATVKDGIHTSAEGGAAAKRRSRSSSPALRKASSPQDSGQSNETSAAATPAEPHAEKKLQSNLRRKNKSPASDHSNKNNNNNNKSNKKVTISADAASQLPPKQRKPKKSGSSLLQRQQELLQHPPELFRPSSDAYTPRMGKKKIEYKPAEMRTPVQKMASPLGTLQRPNFRDALRRVAMILHQHVVKIERRFDNNKHQMLEDDGLFKLSMKQLFGEENYKTPTYKCTMVRVPMARPGMVYGLKLMRQKYEIPTEEEIYEFAHQLFKSVQLSSECSIVCLIYVERLMESAKVPLLSTTWRPIFMCGLLLASKVWQDLSSWNVEFASVYPQYSLESINRLELEFLRRVKWDLYISSSCYAKYYFALRSLVEKPDFRQRYNRMVGGVDNVQASEALKIEKRSSLVKEEALSQLSRSM